MRMLVLGAGLQGCACAFDLLETTEAHVTLADNRVGRLPKYLEKRHHDRLEVIRLDVTKEEDALAVMREHDSVLSALPYYLNFSVSRLSIEAGAHFADLGGNTEVVRQQLGLTPEAQAKGVTVVVDCGLAPGLVNILAASGIRQFDTVDAVRMYVGGLPQHPEPPLNYRVVYSLEGALDYYTTPSWIIRDGEPRQISALTEIEHLTFPDPLGRLEAFHTAGGLSLMPWDFASHARTMEYKTLRYPGHADLMRSIRDLGLLDTRPVAVGETSVSPRDVFIAVVSPKLRDTDPHDVVALRVIVSGERRGHRAGVTWQLIDTYDDIHGITAMMRTTAYSLSITGQLQVGGRMGKPGVYASYQVTPVDEYLAALRSRGIAVESSHVEERAQ